MRATEPFSRTPGTTASPIPEPPWSLRLPLPAVRRRYAHQLLQRDGVVSCQDLRLAFGISEATARRDVSALVEHGAAIRVYGGAVLTRLAHHATSRRDPRPA